MRRLAVIFLFPLFHCQIGFPEIEIRPLRPAFLMQGSEGRDTEFLSQILGEFQVIHHLEKRWIHTAEYKKYALVAIAGVPEEPNFKQTAFNEADLARIEEFLEEGGSLFLMGPAARLFETAHGKTFLTRLFGKKDPPRDDSGDVTTVLIQSHPWTQHLLPQERSKDKDTIQEADLEGVEEEAEAPAPDLLKDEDLATAPVLYKQHPWLIRSMFYWHYPARGNRIIGKASGKTSLYQLPIGKGQIVCTAWDMFRWENPELGGSPELVAQIEILRRICSSLSLYKRNDYLKDRAALMGSDPFLWQEGTGLMRPQPDEAGWYQERGLTVDIGPSGKQEAASSIQMDAAFDEYESASFHLSNFQIPRTLRLKLSVLKTEAGLELPAGSVRVRLQKAFSTEMLAAALHENGTLDDYGPIESLDEARSIAAYLLTSEHSNLSKPIWLFDMHRVGKNTGSDSTFTMAAEAHHSIWLTYEPGRGIVPGRYDGKLKIDAEGGSETVLSVTLNIRKSRRSVQAPLLVAINGSSESPLPLATYNCTVAPFKYKPVELAHLAGSEAPLFQSLQNQPERFISESLPDLEFRGLDDHLGSLSAAGFKSLISGGSLIPIGPFLAALNKATGKVDFSTESVEYRRLEQWFLVAWFAHLRKHGIQGHRITHLHTIDSAGKVGPSIYLSLNATGTFERVDTSKDEVWLEVYPDDEFIPESTDSTLWKGMLTLADYPGVVGLHVIGDARVRYPLTFRWGKEHIISATLEGIRDAVDSASCYRFLTEKARAKPERKLDLSRLEIAKQKSVSEFKKLHSALLDLIED